MPEATFHNAVRFVEEIGIGSAEQDETLCSYHNTFIKPLLHATESYYRRKSRNRLRSHGLSGYLEWTQEHLDNEASVALAFNTMTAECLLADTRFELLLSHSRQIIQDSEFGFLRILEEENTNSLRRMYSLLFEMPSARDLFKSIFSSYVNQKVDTLRDTNSVLEVFELFNHIGSLVKHFEPGQKTFVDAQVKSFSTIDMNRQKSYSGMKQQFEETLCSMVDRLLRRDPVLEFGSYAEFYSEVETYSRFSTLFCDFAVFNKLHALALAKRLLERTTEEQISIETLFIENIEAKNGLFDTSKLRGMIKDCKISLQLAENSSNDRRNSISCPRHARFAHFRNWPTTLFEPENSREHPISQELYDVCMEAEQHFIKSCPSFNTRKIRWVHRLGTASLLLTHDNTEIHVELPIPHACVLLKVGQKKRITVHDLLRELHLADNTGLRFIESLAFGAEDTFLVVHSRNANHKYWPPLETTDLLSLRLVSEFHTYF